MSSPTASPSSAPFRIRQALRSDAASILELIRGLAEYEKAPEEVTNTVEQLQHDGWGPTPRFTAFIAEVPSDATPSPSLSSPPQRAVAFALTFFAYSTWKGTCLYLEDIYVEPSYRGRGIGLALIARCVAHAQTHRCQRVMWQALDWNQPAIDFYTHKLGAVIMKEWVSLRLTQSTIDAFTAKYSDLIRLHSGEGGDGEGGALTALKAELHDGVHANGAAAAVPSAVSPVAADMQTLS